MDGSKEFQIMLDRAIESEPLAFKDFDRTKNVQTQLQEMVIGERKPIELAEHFSGWILSAFGWDYRELFTSMEQLWLAFVMKEKFGKVWRDGEWK